MRDSAFRGQQLVGYWPNQDCRFRFGQPVRRADPNAWDVDEPGAVVGWEDDGLCWVRWSAGLAVAQLEDIDELIACEEHDASPASLGDRRYEDGYPTLWDASRKAQDSSACGLG
ncbi:MAG: hypothetical protein WCG47_06010, partial [Dermatophilaceae bacterium]